MGMYQVKHIFLFFRDICQFGNNQLKLLGHNIYIPGHFHSHLSFYGLEDIQFILYRIRSYFDTNLSVHNLMDLFLYNRNNLLLNCIHLLDNEFPNHISLFSGIFHSHCCKDQFIYKVLLEGYSISKYHYGDHNLK